MEYLLENFPFLNSFDWGAIVFLCLFSLGFSLFFTLILDALYNIYIKPTWLLFAVLPSVIIIIAIISKPLAFVCFVLFFALVPILMIIGIIYKTIKEIRAKFKNKNKKGGVFENIKGCLLLLFFAPIFFLFPKYAFLFFITFFVLKSLVGKSSKSTFLNLQETLPTSKIRSMAMGLVEVQGKAVMQEPLLSKMGTKECIGYVYKVESVSIDKDGRSRYSTLSNTTECNPFLIQDATGLAHVANENLELLNLELDVVDERNKKRYSQYLFKEDTEILLIGKAINKKQQVVIEKESNKNIFALSPISNINVWNKFNPIRKAFITYVYFVAFFVAVILFMNISYHNNEVIINFKSEELSTFDFNKLLNKDTWIKFLE